MTAPVRVPDSVEARVDLAGRAYDIVIGRNQIATLSDRIATLRPGARVAIVTDDEVARHSSCDRGSDPCRRRNSVQQGDRAGRRELEKLSVSSSGSARN